MGIKIMIQRLKDHMQTRRYAPSTIRTYAFFLKDFLAFASEQQPEDLRPADAEPYLRALVRRGASRSTQHQAVNALKYFFEHLRHFSTQYFELPRPRKEKRLPVILSLREVQRLLDHTRNSKHRAMLALIYSAGLRCGELLRLELRDIDSRRMLIHIRDSKGNKDRYVPLARSILHQLRTYYKTYRPQKYLFEGWQGNTPRPGKPYSARSLQQVFRRAREAAGIRKPVTLHSLRHAYATHLYESGVDIYQIQLLLGHQSVKTTAVYTHVSTRQIQSTPSPLDQIWGKSYLTNGK